MKTSKTLVGLGAATIALLIGASVALASPAQQATAPAAESASTITVERRGGPPTPTRPTSGGQGAVTPGADLPDPVDGPLPAEVVDAITDGIVDEWHAYAVYAAAMEQFGAVRPFTMIQQAEASHASAWATIFARYDVPLPEKPAFDIPQFASLSGACAAGAEAEIANADLYARILATAAAYPDIVQVATLLQSASLNNHLPAFARCAAR